MGKPPLGWLNYKQAQCRKLRKQLSIPLNIGVSWDPVPRCSLHTKYIYLYIYIYIYIYNTKLKSVQIEYNHIGILSVPKLPIFGGLNYSNYSPPKIVGYHCIMLNQYSSIDVFLFFVYLINYCYNAVPFLASKVGL